MIQNGRLFTKPCYQQVKEKSDDPLGRGQASSYLDNLVVMVGRYPLHHLSFSNQILVIYAHI